MDIRKKRCTARGQLVDPAETKSGAPTDAKLSDGQYADHYVLCPEDRAKGYVEPYRETYVHVGPPGGARGCGGVTYMPKACAETYAVKPDYYGSTFCCHCNAYFPVGAGGEFVWDERSMQRVGTRLAPPKPEQTELLLDTPLEAKQPPYGTPAKELARRESPDTSKEAAESLDTTKLEREVHVIIHNFRDGCISDQVRAALPRKTYSSVTARFSALERKGYISCGPDKKTGFSGRKQRVMRSLKEPNGA